MQETFKDWLARVERDIPECYSDEARTHYLMGFMKAKLQSLLDNYPNLASEFQSNF